MQQALSLGVSLLFDCLRVCARYLFAEEHEREHERDEAWQSWEGWEGGSLCAMSVAI